MDLFNERLDAFCTSSIRSFADREQLSYEETRQLVAEWHSRFLFSPQNTTELDRTAQIKSILSDTSRILEALSNTTGVQSFVLAVDAADATDTGFLGGSVAGREYWRSLRGGGDSGARAFKSHCLKLQQPEASTSSASSSNARTVKSDLYDAIRKALRTASGVRNAEMKWTNPSLLNIYGVSLVGWPATIPAANPSSLKADQNRQLLEALENGTMYFARILSSAPPETGVTSGEDSSFAWAIQYEPEDTGAPPAKRAKA